MISLWGAQAEVIFLVEEKCTQFLVKTGKLLVCFELWFKMEKSERGKQNKQTNQIAPPITQWQDKIWKLVYKERC